MDWMNQLGGMLGQYANAQPQHAQQMQPNQIDQDFDHVAQHAPPQAMASGLADAFRSSQTPPFPQMTGQLYAQSNPQQQASLLNTLMAAAGPMVVSQMMNRGGGSPLGGALGGLLGGGLGAGAGGGLGGLSAA